MKTHLLLFVVLATTQADTPDARICYPGDLQPCKTCSALAKVVAKTEPDNGDYLHGAQWNGLYTAYVQNCYSVAEKLLMRGANPNWGGSSGSMIISVSDKWPHHDKAVNQRWASLLLRYGASASKPVPDENKTPTELQKEFGATPDYPDIWRQFQY